MSGKIEELAKRYQAGEELGPCDLSRLIRNKHELPEPVQKQLMQEMEQQDYYKKPLSKWQRRRRRKQQQTE